MRALKRFRADENGATAIMFALSVAPLLGLVGAATDYGRATSARAALQRAADSTALALARQSGGLTDGQFQARGREIFDGTMKAERGVTTAAPTITRKGTTVRVSASGEIRTLFGGFVGQDTVAFVGEAAAAWSDRRIELALVLDNTGSMARANKMPELKKALLDRGGLLDKLQSAPNASTNTKVSVVPFDTQVRLSTVHSNRDWLKVLKTEDVLKKHERRQGNEWKRGAWVQPIEAPSELAARNAWTGYVSGRDLHRRDPATGRSVEVGMNAKADPADPRKPETLFPMVRNEEGRDLPIVHPLTNQLGGGSLRKTIADMQPRGCTDITIGAMWGLETLSAAAPFTEAVAEGTADVEKVMVLLTDGWNTRDAFHSVCGEKEGDAVLDRRTSDACQVVKGKGVTLITIKVIEGSDALLQGCASHPTDPKNAFYMEGKPLYFPVGKSDDLTPVFQRIADQILGTRLTH